jgi:hypothetical protein
MALSVTLGSLDNFLLPKNQPHYNNSTDTNTAQKAVEHRQKLTLMKEIPETQQIYAPKTYFKVSLGGWKIFMIDLRFYSIPHLVNPYYTFLVPKSINKFI